MKDLNQGGGPTDGGAACSRFLLLLFLCWPLAMALFYRKFRFADFKTITRSKTLPLPISSTHEIYQVVKDLYEALCDEVKIVEINESNHIDEINTLRQENLQLQTQQISTSLQDAKNAIDVAQQTLKK